MGDGGVVQLPAAMDIRHVQKPSCQGSVQTPTRGEELSKWVVGHVAGATMHPETRGATAPRRRETIASIGDRRLVVLDGDRRPAIRNTDEVGPGNHRETAGFERSEHHTAPAVRVHRVQPNVDLGKRTEIGDRTLVSESGAHHPKPDQSDPRRAVELVRDSACR